MRGIGLGAKFVLSTRGILLVVHHEVTVFSFNLALYAPSTPSWRSRVAIAPQNRNSCASLDCVRGWCARGDPLTRQEAVIESVPILLLLILLLLLLFLLLLLLLLVFGVDNDRLPLLVLGLRKPAEGSLTRIHVYTHVRM